MTRLMYYEWYKTFGGFKWLIIVAVLIVKAVFTYQSLDVSVDFSIPIYQEYISQLSHMSLSDAENFILSENERISSILGARSEMENDYSSGRLSLDEYKAYMKTYHEAEAKSPAFNAVYQKYEQLSLLDEKNRVYFYDLEWYTFGKYLGLDFFVILLLTIFGIPIFCREHSCNTHHLNTVCKNGRVRLHLTKLVLALITGLMLGALVYSVDFAVFGLRYGFADSQMPIQAVMGYGSGADDVSVLRLFVTMTVSKVLWCGCLALMIAGTCALIRNNIISIIVCAVLLLFTMQVLELNNGSPSWLHSISILTGMSGTKENADMLTPLMNMSVWAVINILIMAILYPKRMKRTVPCQEDSCKTQDRS